MDNKYLNEVLDRLENYQKMMRQIELLQYEIQYASHVTPTEMIEVMTFQKRDADNAGTNAYPKSVPEIAMSYQRAAAQLNGESVEELISKYADLCHEQDRLSHYISAAYKKPSMSLQSSGRPAICQGCHCRKSLQRWNGSTINRKTHSVCMSFVKRWMLPAEHFTITFSAAQIERSMNVSRKI